MPTTSFKSKGGILIGIWDEAELNRIRQTIAQRAKP